MIPKKIHYCWFGNGEKPKRAIKCIESWKKFCPDYEIIEWNENNYDININTYVKNAYELKKYAFMTDYIRLDVMKQFGGIYFDTDVELIKNIDSLLTFDFFAGFENSDYINTGLGFGSIANGEFVSAMENEYNCVKGKKEFVGCPILNTKALKGVGVEINGKTQKISNNIIFEPRIMSPYDYTIDTMNKTEETISIHWYGMSWQFNHTRIITKLKSKIKKLLIKLKLRK